MCRLNIHPRPPRTNCTWASLTNLWIPGGAPRLRCVIVHSHGGGGQASKGGETAAYDLHWQALAKKWDCALLGPFYHVLGEKTDTSPGASEL